MANSVDVRSRRSSSTVRELVLQAARELFDGRPYEEVGTREIATRAGVTHALVFRHFGTKANLFVEAAFQPFRDFVTSYLDQWVLEGHGSSGSAHYTETFVHGLYRLLLDNRPLLVAMAGQSGGGSTELRERAAAFLQEIFERLERESELEIEVKRTVVMDIRCAVRFSFGLVYGITLLDPLLFHDASSAPSRETIAEEMSGFVLRGTLLRTEGLADPG
ncbi:TetR/AcrR family transcriptional regulator [Frankia canadensis]|nr:TetR/AcrR family transcriptional regulator [Frankia canadensis]